MITDDIFPSLRMVWGSLQDWMPFLPPFPDRLDSLALFSLLLVAGLLAGEWLHARLSWPRIIGYVLAGSLFGPSMLGWISYEGLAQTRPFADAALGLLLLEAGRRLDLRWAMRNRELLLAALGDSALTFLAVFLFAWGVVGLSVAWAGACAAVTMATAPAVVLLTIEEGRAQGQVTERLILHASLGSAVAFIVFALVLSLVHAQHGGGWVNALAHPLWVAVGALLIGWPLARLALLLAARLPKRSLSQVFVLVACALLAIGIARMLAVPVFLTLFLLGAMLAYSDTSRTLSYTDLPEAHWLLAIVLFVVVGATLPWHDFTWLLALQALGLLVVRAAAKAAALLLTGGSLPVRKRLLVAAGIQPLSVTAVIMAYEIANLYPEIGRVALTLPLMAAALMELASPGLCRLALRQAGELAEDRANEGARA